MQTFIHAVTVDEDTDGYKVTFKCIHKFKNAGDENTQENSMIIRNLPANKWYEEKLYSKEKTTNNKVFWAYYGENFADKNGCMIKLKILPKDQKYFSMEGMFIGMNNEYIEIIPMYFDCQLGIEKEIHYSQLAN